jgi:hypothetical protein
VSQYLTQLINILLLSQAAHFSENTVLRNTPFCIVSSAIIAFRIDKGAKASIEAASIPAPSTKPFLVEESYKGLDYD